MSIQNTDGTIYDKSSARGDASPTKLPIPATSARSAPGSVTYGGRDGSWVVVGNEQTFVGRVGVESTCPPVRDGQTVLVGGADLKLHCYDFQGRELWSLDVETRVRDILPTHDGKIFVFLSGGVVLLTERGNY